LVYKSVFSKNVSGKIMPVGLVENVPERYGGNLERLSRPFEMAGKEIGSPLPMSLQTKWFTKRFFENFGALGT
jgi:hypothetical protein